MGDDADAASPLSACVGERMTAVATWADLDAAVQWNLRSLEPFALAFAFLAIAAACFAAPIALLGRSPDVARITAALDAGDGLRGRFAE